MKPADIDFDRLLKRLNLANTGASGATSLHAPRKSSGPSTTSSRPWSGRRSPSAAIPASVASRIGRSSRS